MANKKDLFGGFDALSGMLVRDNDADDVIEVDNELSVDDSTDITPGKKAQVGVKTEVVTIYDEDVAKESEEDVVVDDEVITKKPKVEADVEEADEEAGDVDFLKHEGDISAFFAADLAEKLGVDIPEDYKKIEKLDDVVDLLVDIIKENSKPVFANEEVEKYNKFVEEGGDLRKFYEDTYASTIDPNKLDPTKPNDQKEILRQHMINQGYKDERIKRAIDRYEEAGVLQDEAEEALDLVKEFSDKKAKKLLAEQEKFNQEQDKAKQIFVDTVYDTIKEAKDVRGISLSESEKKELLDYMFKTDTKGMTALQRDYQDPKKRIDNIIESAYFMKYGDKIINKNKEQGATDAYKAIREKLKAGKGKRSAGSNTSFDKASKPLRDLSSLLINS
jgi:hypothetical protein